MKRVHEIARLLKTPALLPGGLPRIHHDFDFIGYRDGLFQVLGWAVSPLLPWTRAVAYLNGVEMGESSPRRRKDVADALPHFPWAEHSPFFFMSREAGIGIDHTDRLDLVFYSEDRPIAAVWTPVRSDLPSLVPVPPAHLMQRVIGTDRVDAFLNFALTCMGQYLEGVARAKSPATIKRLLDWGCGCGRVTAHYLMLDSAPEVVGCDIDAEDIEWCRGHLSPGQFDVTSPFPPLPYDSGSFDAVVSLSVLTHLTRQQQLDWLAEMDRVLAEDGVFAASVLGPWGADRRPDRYFADRIANEEFFDDVHDSVLDGIAPEGYYRATYQRESYTRATFGRFFDVVDYIEGGVGIQDLVIAKKKPAQAGCKAGCAGSED